MSFHAGRLAATEGAYFLQASKQAVDRLIQKGKVADLPLPVLPPDAGKVIANDADVLPEVLKHSLPPNIFRPASNSSLSTASKWALQSEANINGSSSLSRDALNPLRAYVSLPQVTFGPRRWELPTAESRVLASTANELRRDKNAPVNPENLKAAAAGLSQIAKAFAVATVIVFGGATFVFGLVAAKLELHNTDDIRVKGKDFIQPKLETIKDQATPFKNWAESISSKWRMEKTEDVKAKPLMIKELSKMLGAKTPN